MKALFDKVKMLYSQHKTYFLVGCGVALVAVYFLFFRKKKASKKW